MDGNGETVAAVAEAGNERNRQWAALVGEQASTGLSAAEFCRQRQVPVWKFYWWRQRIRGGTEPEAGGQAGGGFVRVAVTGGVNGLGPGGVAVRPSDGLVLVGRGFDRATLRDVLAAMAEDRV